MINAQAFGMALFQLSEEEKKVKKVYDQSHDFLKLARNFKDGSLAALLNAYTLTKKEKLKLIDKLFKNHFCDLFVDFLKTIVLKGYFNLVEQALKYFFDCVENEKHVQFIRIITAFELSAAQLKRIVAAMEKKLNSKIVYKTEIDKSLISGIRIESSAQLFEKNIRDQLSRLMEQFKGN